MWPTLARLGRSLLDGLRRLVYPRVCVLCQGSLLTDAGDDDAGPFCPSCSSALLLNPFAACPRCASNIGPHALIDRGCSRCRGESLGFDAAVRLGPYDGVLRASVLRIKHHSGEGLAELLGELLGRQAGDTLRGLGVERIVPVPLHWRRRWRRGYNQSEGVAHGLAAVLQIPVETRCLRRVRATPKQVGLSPTARKENVRDAFSVRHAQRLQHRTILLVDDVATTGATLSEAARSLRDAGVARVVAAVLARAGLD